MCLDGIDGGIACSNQFTEKANIVTLRISWANALDVSVMTERGDLISNLLPQQQRQKTSVREGYLIYFMALGHPR